MNYEEFLTTITEVTTNDKIYKQGLTLVYEMDDLKHKKFDEHLYYKSNPNGNDFQHRDEFSVEIGEIVVKFIKPKK
jgi:hypothetical protein